QALVSVAAGDLNGDLQTDLVLAESDLGKALVMLGNGDGSFRQGAEISLGDHAGRPVLADLDGDGKLDLAIVSMTNYAFYLSVAYGDGSGGFSSPVTYFLNGSTEPSTLTVADVDGDGRPDIVVANADLHGIGVYVNQGSRTFALKGQVSLYSPSGI